MSRKQLISYVVTTILYGFLLGWKWAALLTFGIGFHEMCHIWMARKQGLPTGGFYLIPFMGGVALMTGRYKTLWQQAQVVLAGPLGGGLMACLFCGVYFITGVPVIGAAGILMLLLNVFNLLPMSFMDGGQLMGTITYTVSRKLGLIVKIASSVVAAVVLLWMNPILSLFVVVFGGMEIHQEFRNYQNLKAGRRWLVPDTYLYPPTKLSTKQLIMTISGHLGTAVLLGSVLFITENAMHMDSIKTAYDLMK